MSSRFLNPSAEAFLKSGTYLRNWSPRTVHTYRQGLTCLYQTVPTDQIPTKPLLDRWVIDMRERGITPGGANMYIRTINSYLSWLRETGEMGHRLRVGLLKTPIKHLNLLSRADIKLLLAYAPDLPDFFGPVVTGEWR